MVRIGLSWHGGEAEYDAYERALLRRSQALGVPVSTVWLAGSERPSLAALLPTLDGIVLTGGEDVEPYRYGRADAAGACACDPLRDATEWALLENLRRLPVPMLAICRGAQLLNVFHGGTLVPDLGKLNHTHQAPPEREHDVEILAGTTLSAITALPLAKANSSHHQAVDRLAEGYRVSARAADGTIEAFESARPDVPFTLAVQWHPERMPADSVLADSVLSGFLRAAVQKAQAGLSRRSP
jgi:putative glutamine amidotransferase